MGNDRMIFSPDEIAAQVAKNRIAELEARVKELEAVLLKYGDMQGSLLEKDVLCETIKKAEAERDRLAADCAVKDAALVKARTTCAFLQCAVKSGEKWSGQANNTYFETITSINEALAADHPGDKLLAERDRLAAVNAGLREALGASIQAIDDWLHQYAPDFCGKNYVVETHKRIIESGGTLAYITDVQAKNRQALAGDGSAVLAVVTAARLMRPLGPVTSSPDYTEGWKKLCQALAKLDSEDNWLERQLDSSKAETEAWSDEKKRIYGIDSEDVKEVEDA